MFSSCYMYVDSWQQKWKDCRAATSHYRSSWEWDFKNMRESCCKRDKHESEHTDILPRQWKKFRILKGSLTNKVKLSAVCVDNMHALLSQCNLNSLKYDCKTNIYQHRKTIWIDFGICRSKVNLWNSGYMSQCHLNSLKYGCKTWC